MTISIDEQVYEGLYRIVGARRISQFIESLIRPHVVDQSMEEAYKTMAADEERESEAIEWTEAVTVV